MAGLSAQEAALREELSMVEGQLLEATELLQAVTALHGGVTPASTASGSEGSRKRKAGAAASSSWT